MKVARIIPFLSLVFLTACGGGDKPVESENALEELNDVFEDLSEELSEIDGVEEIYTLSSESAGDFVLGAAIPESTDDYTVAEENLTIESEEGPYTETIYNVSNDEEELLKILREYNYETGEYADLIGEMNIASDRFQTAEGIGVGSTITDFMAAYPDYKIWYTYVSDMYVIESESLTIQFLLDGSGFEGNMEQLSDMVTLSDADFKADTEIKSIRMFKI